MCDLGINPESFNPRLLYVFERKISEKNKIPCHCHDFVSLIYVISGNCIYNIDGTHIDVKKGNLLILNPNVYHERLLSPGEEISELHIGFNNISVKNIKKDCLIDDKMAPVLTLSLYEQEFVKCCNEMLIEQQKNEPGCDLILKTLVMKLIVIILKETYAIKNPNEILNFNYEGSYDKTTIVNTIITFMNENYMKQISLDKISKNMYLSPIYISKIFKDETGESPINYLIKVRLAKAREMLESGCYSIKTIAKNVGYNDAYYFSKLFKKYYGFSPSNYIKIPS